MNQEHAAKIVTTAPRFLEKKKKKDGKTLRTATGTTLNMLLPESGRSTRSSHPGYVCYFDLGIMACRSFYLDNVKSIEALSNTEDEDDESATS